MRLAARLLLSACCVAFGCASNPPQSRQATTSNSVAASTMALAPARAVSKIESAPAIPCTTGLPLVVTVSNQTTSKGDLCAAFRRAVSAVGQVSGLGTPGQFQVEITLRELRMENGAHCTLSMRAYANGPALVSASAAATVAQLPPGTRQELARDCIDTVIAELMRSNILPALHQQLASAPAAPVSPPLPNGGPTPPPTPGSP